MMDQYIEFIFNHYLLSLALLVVTYLLAQDLIENSFNKFKGLSPLLAVTKMNAQGSVIVDVREPHEYSKGCIEGSINIPLDKIADKIDTLDQYKNQNLIVVCQTGTRSVAACKKLTSANFEQVFMVSGGMQSWEDNKLPMQHQ